MSGMTISGAIVLALVAITLWVFAGGKGDGQATSTTPLPATGNAACQTPSGSNCVQAAQDLVNGLNAQSQAQPGTGYSPAR
jgi:hypothetical protein